MMSDEKEQSPADEAKRRGDGELDRQVQLRIGEGLRAMYDDIVKQGVPDRFVELLAKLDENGGKKDPFEK